MRAFAQASLTSLKGVEMRIRRLGYAGIEIEASGEIIVIDLLTDTSKLSTLREPAEAFPSPSQPSAAMLALVTHLHVDHADPNGIAQALRKGGTILRPRHADGDPLSHVSTGRAESGFLENGLDQKILREWETVDAAPFHIIAVPAVDGLGDPQISWVIEADGKRIFHGGDTMFHGYWWEILRRCGSIDAAFLPVNGMVVNLPHLQPPSSLAAVMDPLQAAVAARILNPSRAIPIHYGSIHKPPRLSEIDQAPERFRSEGESLGVTIELVKVGEWIGGF